MAYYVYILISEKDGRTYTGYTKNLRKRLREHDLGRVKSTRYRRPLKILFTEKFLLIKEAKARELWWKGKSGRRRLKQYFLENF
jgi:putative endonuclease